MLSWTLAALLAEPGIDGIVVSLAKGDTRWQDLPESSYNDRLRLERAQLLDNLWLTQLDRLEHRKLMLQSKHFDR